ncbi:MAG: AsmA-like C-terminal region-containing protein [Verrucomicrobiota bacterium]
MSRLLKIFIFVFSLFCVAVICLFLWVNSLVRSPQAISSLQEFAVTYLKADIEFQSIKANILDGFNLNHVLVTRSQEIPTKEVVGTKLEIDKLKVRYALLPLFLKTIKLSNVELLRPNLNIIQQDDGSWDMPNLDPSLQLLSKPSVQLFGQRFAFALDRLKLRHGEFIATHRDDWTILNIKGADVEGRFHEVPQKSDALGKLHFDELVIAHTLSMQHLRAPIHADHGKLILPQWHALSHEGNAKGSASLDFSAEPALYEIFMSLTDVNLSHMMTTFGENSSSFLSGLLNLEVDLEGDLSQISAITGTGNLEIRDASFSQLPGLQLLSNLLNLDHLADTTYEKVKGSFKIEDQKLTFYDLQAPDEQIRFTGSGYLSFDNQLNFEIRLAISPEMAERIPKEFATNFKHHPDGYRTLLFTLSGDLQNPKTNLDKKLAIDSSVLATDIQDFQSRREPSAASLDPETIP